MFYFRTLFSDLVSYSSAALTLEMICQILYSTRVLFENTH